MAELDQKDYHKLDAPLSEILSSMKLKDDERKEANKYLIEIIENEVIPAMQDVDEFFKIVYKRLTPSGSYYENLKISKPNEFDRNVELAIPFKDIEVRSSSFYGYVQVKCNGDKKRFAEKGEKILKNWLDSDGMLKRNEVLQWMQSVMDRALCKKPIENVKIFPSRHGPAITLTIIVKSSSGKELEFCVDLVPVFSFDEAHWPKPPVRQPFINLPDFPKTWCIVPKEVPNNPEETTHWRISFYDQERRLMNGYNAMKAILKLIKKLRDCQNNCDYLSSYYIKTVFLWEMEKEKYSEEFWQKSIGVLFIDVGH
ncbi:cyclic GMP-AMP synthase-like receptor isoform X2 [Anabrus simplex]|uniref:cyclic GMP-AMP synthase-like receptor isoform X2 n=1 Tax=Anabrus simplex TaxID=316456 RepID=UPI0035A2A182